MSFNKSDGKISIIKIRKLVTALGVVFSLSAAAFSNSSWAVTQPDWAKTPGVVCTESDPNFDHYDYPDHVARCKRNVPIAEKYQVAHEYGDIPRDQWPNYEFDHLIPLCAGGSNDIGNIWPQPIDDAHKKDVLENEICIGLKAGTLTQQQALQRVHDWFATM